MTKLDDSTGLGQCCWRWVLGRVGDCLASRVLLQDVRRTINIKWDSPIPALPTDPLDRWRKLDFALSQSFHCILKQSRESLTEDVVLKIREYAQSNKLLNGRHIIWMVHDYFKTNRTLQEQYKYQYIEALKWMGDDKLP